MQVTTGAAYFVGNKAFGTRQEALEFLTATRFNTPIVDIEKYCRHYKEGNYSWGQLATNVLRSLTLNNITSAQDIQGLISCIENKTSA